MGQAPDKGCSGNARQAFVREVLHRLVLATSHVGGNCTAARCGEVGAGLSSGFLVVTGVVAQLGDLLFDLVAVIDERFFEVGDFNVQSFFGCFNLELATLLRREIGVESFKGSARCAFLAFDQLLVGLLHLVDAELSGGAEDFNFLAGSLLALLEDF